MRSVEVGGRRETQRLTERYTEAKRIDSLSRISPSNLFFVLVHSLVKQGVHICVYAVHTALKITTIIWGQVSPLTEQAVR